MFYIFLTGDFYIHFIKNYCENSQHTMKLMDCFVLGVLLVLPDIFCSASLLTGKVQVNVNVQGLESSELLRMF